MKKGFTLVELSIVLVIIGLLIGGILVGQSLIDSSKIQSQIRQFNQYDIAISNFKLSYNQLPGDCSICNHPFTYGYENDGMLTQHNGQVAPQLMFAEAYYFFTDLSDFNMINESYAVSGNNVLPGVLFPEADIGRGGIIVSGTRDGSIFYTFAYEGNTIANSSYASSTGGLLYEGNISPIEALALDKKLDDGLPSSGDVASVTSTPWVSFSNRAYPFTLETVDATCISTGTPNSYNVASDDTSLCKMVFKSQYK